MAARAKKTSAKNTQTALTNTARTPKPAEFTKEEELEFYREMLLIRRFEEKAGSCMVWDLSEDFVTFTSDKKPL